MVDADAAVAYEASSTPTNHVDSISMYFTTTSRKYTIYTEVVIKDGDGNVLQGATVTMILSYSRNSQTIYTTNSPTNSSSSLVRINEVNLASSY